MQKTANESSVGVTKSAYATVEVGRDCGFVSRTPRAQKYSYRVCRTETLLVMTRDVEFLKRLDGSY
jgi:hypothetical protein